jgi:TIR domain
MVFILPHSDVVPLLFFLNCLEADDARLPELIRDEIKARTFTVLCNTLASRLSKWVKQETQLDKHVTRRPRTTVVVVNRKGDLETELHKLDWLSERDPGFLSYARQDQKIAERIRRALQRRDYSVWFDSAVRPERDWSSVRTFGAGVLRRGSARIDEIQMTNSKGNPASLS